VEVLIYIGLVILIIYGIVKLIIWLVPKIAMAVLFLLAAGGAVGLLFGVFQGIKSYMLSIHENINNGALRVTMMFITALFILVILAYSAAAVYYIVNFLK